MIKILTPQELEVVRECKELGFGSYLSSAFLEYPRMIRQLQAEKYPSKRVLDNMNDRMDDKRFAFDLHYLIGLARMSVNPLQVEQEAWRLLSPLVKAQVVSFGEYVKSYSPTTATQEPLLTHVNNGWTLIQYWNTISNCYKTKLDEVFEEILGREEEVRGLIRILSGERR